MQRGESREWHSAFNWMCRDQGSDKSLESVSKGQPQPLSYPLLKSQLKTYFG